MAYILVVDDESKMRHLLAIMLGRKGHKVDQAPDGQVALSMVKENPYDMVITDIKMPNIDGMGLLKEITQLNLPCPVVFITAFATVESAVNAMRNGAADYITKPFDEDRILMTVTRTLHLSRIMSENKDLKEEIRKLSKSEKIVYKSARMSEVIELAVKVAKTDTAVMLNGESGTGKELLAKFIHNTSFRSGLKFVPVNCAAISPALVESELFGYEKGAFTGANKRTVGKFEYASGGTLFLDEIGDLQEDAQAKLLRAIQEKKIQRVGGHEEIKVDVRIICATNQNLELLVEKGKFREDLFYRVNVFPIQPPPLRERKDDIVPLAKYFVERIADGRDIQLTDGAVRVLSEYNWPGNIRELANGIERAIILSIDQGVITSDTLHFLRTTISNGKDSKSWRLPSEGISLEALQSDLVKQALDISNNNQTAAAEILGLTRAKFRVLMRQATGK